MAGFPAKKLSMSSPWNEVGIHPFHMDSIWKIAGSLKTSVKEYLMSQYTQSHNVKQVRYFSFSEEQSHCIISQICLAYLLQFNTSEPLDVNLDVSSPLAKYAAKQWIIHVYSGWKSKSQSSLIFALVTKLLTDENNSFVEVFIVLH